MKIANISGGRTSMYMGIMLQRNGFDGIYCFQNTGMESPPTYEFLKLAPFPITVLQYTDRPPFFTVETIDTINKSGEPFKKLARKRKMMPNVAQRFCTQELKIETLRRYLRSEGVKEWTNLLGIRYDEPKRVRDITANYTKRQKKQYKFYAQFPLFDAKVTSRDIGEFWERHNWNLDLPMLPNGKTLCGNCVGCFQKSEAELAMMLKEYPSLYKEMEKLEKEIGGTLRKESLEDFRKHVERDNRFEFNMDNGGYCTNELGGCGD